MGVLQNRVGALSPVVRLKLDGTGIPVSDGSASLTLSQTGAATAGQSGIDGTNSYYFDGNAGYTIPSFTAFNDYIFSMEVWFKMPSSQTTRTYPTIFRSTTGAGNPQFIFRAFGSNTGNTAVDGKFQTVLFGNSGTAVDLTTSYRIDDNQWHHAVFVMTAVNDHKLYVDGQLAASATTNIGTFSLDSATYRRFGYGDSTSVEGWVGNLDEFAIYNTALTPGQVYSNYAAGKDALSMQAKITSYNPEWYWEMDTDMSVATPTTLYSYGSQIDSSVTWARTTVSGSSISRVASTLPTSTVNPYMFSVPYASRYRSSTTSLWTTELTDKNFTFGLWWKMNTGTSSSSALTHIGGFGASACVAYMYSQTNASTPGRVFWNVAGQATAGTTRIDDGNWHFLAVRSTGDNTYKCFVDGVLDATVTTTSAISPTNLQIGDSTQGSTSATGYIDSMFLAPASNVLEADILGIYQLAFPPNVNKTINETPATASSQFPDATATGTSTVSWSTTPATVNAEFVTPALSFSQDIDRLVSAFTSDSTFVDPTISRDCVLENQGIMNASADVAPIGLIIDDGFNALVASANAGFSVVEPVISTEKSASFSALPMTANGEAGGRRYIREIDPLVTEDRMYKGLTGGWDPADFGNLRFENTNGSSLSDTNYFVFDTIPARVESNRNNLLAAKLSAYVADLFGQGGLTQTLYLHRILSPWSETDTFQPTISSAIGPVTVTLPASNNMPIEIDLTPLIADWINGTYPNYGFAITSADNTAGWRIHSSEAVNSTYRPKVILVVDYGLDDINPVAPVATASAQMADPNLNIGTAGSISATPITASALAVDPTISAGTAGGYTAEHLEAFGVLVDPTVSVQRSYNFTQSDGLTANGIFVHPQTIAEGATLTIDTSPATASATMPGGIPSINETVGSDPFYALNAEMVNPTISSDFNRIIYVGAFSVSATLLDPTEAVLETDDPYYQNILATSNINDVEWFRLDEISGNIAYSKGKQINASNLQNNGTYVNTPVFGGVGPRNRKVVGFTGSQYITIPHTTGGSGTSGNIDWLGAAATSATEMVIKTVANTGTLVDGTDFNNFAGAGTFFGWLLEIVDGKLRYRKFYNGTGGQKVTQYEVTGFKTINDNNWHHIVVQIGNIYNGKELEVYIDGELDIARYDATDTPIMAHPDTIFNFAGEAMEYVFRPNITLTEYQIEQLYYSALDIATEQVDVWTASAVMPEPYVSGNKPKALMLSFWPYADYRDTITFNPTFDEYPEGGARYVNGGFDPEVYDVWEYYVNRTSVNPQLTSISDTPEIGGFHRDPVTDEPVLLDPRTIRNIDKFDIVQVNGYPVDSNDINAILPQSIAGGAGDYQENLKALETFVGQLRNIVDTYGTSLVVTNPRLAADLGIIDDAEFVGQLYESRFDSSQSSQNQGLYDYRSSKVDPVANSTGIGSGTNISPYGYFDLHRNNKLRIVATQTGLTDLTGGWTLQDAVTYIPRDPLAIERYSYKYKDTRSTGLTIGDELFIAGLQSSRNQLGTASGDVYGVFPAQSNFVAFPPGSVKAGTIIAQLGATYWNGTEERANPYANYAAAIVVNPGDSLKGTAVGGKIYVDVTNRQDTRYATAAIFQTTNGSAENPVIPGITDAATNYEKEWQYSTGRLSLTGDQANVTVDQAITTPDQFNSASSTGALRQVTNPSTGETYFVKAYSTQLFSIIVEEKYPTVQVWAPSLFERGMMWLRSKVVVNPNDATIRPAAMIAEAIQKNSGLYINKDIITNAASMVSNAYLVEPDNVISVDARIVVLPLTATARITGYSRLVEADPMTASAILNTDSVTFAGGEQVVVTLHEAISIDLYIKEEAY